MTIKNKFKVYGFTWRVVYVDNLFVDGDKCDGGCLPVERIIQIEKNISKKVQKGAFYHELIHAICSELKLNQTDLCENVLEIVCEGVGDYLNENFNITWKKKT